jgi:hypothetical protein
MTLTVNQACAREQTHFGRTLDDVIIGNQITIVCDEKPVPVAGFCVNAANWPFQGKTTPTR